MNTDKLSFSESRLIVDKLDKFHMAVSNLFLNKWHPGFDSTVIKKKYEGYGFQLFPESEKPLLGVKTLTDFLTQLDHFIEL